jgi:hypothetical protein
MDGDAPHEMKSMMVVWTCDDDQAPGLEKEEGNIHRAILFLVIKTL